MSSEGWELVADLSWPRSRDEGARGYGCRADFEDDQEGVRTMDDDNFIDDTWSGSADLSTAKDNEGFIGDAPQPEKGHELESLLIFCLAKRLLQSTAEVLGRGCQREVARSEVDTVRAILGASRLVKKSGDRERTPDFGIEDEEPAFMRDEFASEPSSSQKRKGSKEDRFIKKEKKLKGDKKFDKGGR
ncbi:hypothetical protein Syun_008476 [Stephania yunnanensis]|uniref:Uncharacterized protein n=1 Tax=Stephania yunnanensis TaxID=152371 RepID=A0AAP0KF89_9MAGN